LFEATDVGATSWVEDPVDNSPQLIIFPSSKRMQQPGGLRLCRHQCFARSVSPSGRQAGRQAAIL
jgi:hypothetical protein